MEFNLQKFYPPPNIHIPYYLPITTDQTGNLGKSVLVTVLRNSSQSHGVKNHTWQLFLTQLGTTTTFSQLLKIFTNELKSRQTFILHLNVLLKA